ncbi:uroporphyrinogen-III synthase [Methylosinus sp. sav-2]|uniref:uroporphyrinogen-III synthase n=1 Tax=Methylosinus sp. sav-2 TaxID=2485168 RepID=UPI0004793540|nr:uroporphyrinogen-III synthase [Methylosinus sp. sav-2]TDX64782.1 uroporphyrinogen-III synthase [Methylosinus sp. sav-2]
MRRVLVTRAREDAERTAEELRRRGFAPLIAPVLEIAATGAPIPAERFDAVLATSARAIQFAEGLAASSAPFFVVGGKTAQALSARGAQVEASAPDVAALTLLLGARFAAPARFLYLAGHDRKDDLESFLRARGHVATVVETYEARAVAALGEEARAALAAGEIDAALHYSARSASIFLALADAAGAPATLRTRVTHFALSEDVARVLRAAGCANVRVAAAPDQASLLAALEAQ